MRMLLLQTLVDFLTLIVTGTTPAAGPYFEVTYPSSTQPGELQLGVTYMIWIPNGATKLRGVIVHQHGCGSGACKAGQIAADDLHWQALAKKWDCALLGPSYHQDDKQNRRLWCNPRNDSTNTRLHFSNSDSDRGCERVAHEPDQCGGKPPLLGANSFPFIAMRGKKSAALGWV